MPRPLIAILGCGWIARRHAAAAQRLSAHLDLAFASRSGTRARAYARAFGAVAAFDGYESAVRDPRVRAAIVCTPHDRHLADVLLALDHDRHVLVEKPIARTLAEADQMIEAARARGQVLMVAENFHYMPAFRRVRAVVAGGRLGALRDLLLTSRGFRERTGWRLDPEAAGGGCLIDGGIHYVHNLRSWGGEVRRVFGLSPPPTLARLAGEDAVSALLELDRGVVGFLANSVATPGTPTFQWASVSGTQGTCFADNRGRLVVIRGGSGSSVRAYWRDHRGYEAMLRAFLHAITTGRAPETDGGEGRRDLAVVLAVYRSLRERQPVDVEC
jgi:predicted dehydrogenase